jgi:hypothetical protein
LNQFLEDIAEEQLFKGISPNHQAKEIARKQQLSEFSSNYPPEFKEVQPGIFERLNPIVLEFIEEPESRAMKKPVDEKGYPFVSQSDAARILEIDTKQVGLIAQKGIINQETEIVQSKTKIWIRLLDLQHYLESRDQIKAGKIRNCLLQIDEFRALASQNGFKLRFLGSDYDRPDFYKNLSR